MRHIRVLDCTLRDGGYCNEWRFGRKNITTIIEGLQDANIDVIECGFLTNKVKHDVETSKFNTLNQIGQILPDRNEKIKYVCMINYGEYNVDDLPEYDGTSVDGIRVAFHKKDMKQAIRVCREINEKGYRVFVQPMVCLAYTDDEFSELIELCNDVKPYAFYIVDSFGVMKRGDLMHYLNLVKMHLDENIVIGFHSHNNMQLAYSNAQTLVEECVDRQLLIDSSVFGMGRGAGNLNTELFIEYLNDNYDAEYRIKPLLQIIDDVLNFFYEKNYWGYSLPNYLSAKHNAHPNYASFLMGKHTLTVHDMDEIFSMIPHEKKVEYDAAYIDEIYTNYLARGIEKCSAEKHFSQNLQGKRVMIIAPGRSAEDEKEKILAFSAADDVISFGVNFEYEHLKTDYVFVSNLRRFHHMEAYEGDRTIVTSNIEADDAYITVDYSSLLNDVMPVKDNAGLMLISYLISSGVKEIYLAGMDGYSHEMGENYAADQMEFMARSQLFDVMNMGIEKVLKKYASMASIQFITTPKYIRI